MTDTKIDWTLEERNKRYGKFMTQAKITQNIKRAMESSRNWNVMTPDKQEALHMIANKIGRILNGDPAHIDSWHDIMGYARLVEQNLQEEEETQENITKVIQGHVAYGEANKHKNSAK